MHRIFVVLLAAILLTLSPATFAQSAKPARSLKGAKVRAPARKGKTAKRSRRAVKPQRRSTLRRALKRAPRGKRSRVEQKRVRRGSGKGLVFRVGRIKRNVDLVIFDLDGTIAETRTDIADNFEAGFKSIGVKVPKQRLLDLVDGSPLHKTYWTIQPNGSEAGLKKFLAGFETSQNKRGPRGTAYEHIPQLLRALSKQKGVKLAVATARPPENAARLLKHMGLRNHFDIVAGTHGTGMPHKPAPDMLLYVAERAGVSPQRTVFIGDTYTDMQAGKNAGMSTVAMTYGMGITKRLLAQKPDASTGSAKQLYKMFGIDPISRIADTTATVAAPVIRARTDRHAAEAR